MNVDKALWDFISGVLSLPPLKLTVFAILVIGYLEWKTGFITEFVKAQKGYKTKKEIQEIQEIVQEIQKIRTELEEMKNDILIYKQQIDSKVDSAKANLQGMREMLDLVISHLESVQELTTALLKKTLTADEGAKA